MTIYKQLVKELDDQIERLTNARNALMGSDGARPKQRVMSPEARERIAAAQRKRWALAKKTKKAK